MAVFDGTIIDLQDRDGTVGTTAGNILFAAKSGKDHTSRGVRISQLGLVVDSQNIDLLLADINTSLRKIRDKLRT